MYVLILVILAVAGAFMVAPGRPLAANVFGVVSNPLMSLHNYYIGQHEQAVMFFFTAS